MLKVLELFGGIGAPRKALENLGFKVKTIDYVEWWKWPVDAYNRLFDNNYQTQDVKTWNMNIDILFHGSPCQDWSNAGKQDLTKGRSMLYLRTLEIIAKELNPKPKYVIWENVLGLISKKHQPYFQHYLDTLTALGYTNYWKVLNAKDFGIPQSRNRVFVVSIRNDLNQSFNFDNLKTTTMKPLLNFIDINENNPIYFIKSESMKKAVATGKIKIINDYTNTVTTKQDRWHNAGTIAVPLDIKNLADGKVKISDLTNFNQDNYVTKVNDNNAIIKTLQSSNRAKVAIPITNEILEIQEHQDFTNFMTIPRTSDGKCINGAYNRIWKSFNPNSYVGTVAVTSPIKVAIPIHNVAFNNTGKTNIPINSFKQESYVYDITNQETMIGTITTNIKQSKLAVPVNKDCINYKYLGINKDYDYRMSDGSTRPIGEINKEGKTTIPITNNHSANKCGVSIIPTITTAGNVKVVIPTINPIPHIPIFIIDNKPYHLRVLTPKETWLLMGFTSNDFEKVKNMPKTHLYHMAGNSIVVPVLEAIFQELLKEWK